MSTLFGWLLEWVVGALVIGATAYLLPGVKVKNFGTALWVALVLGLINVFVRPLMIILTIPITIITFGLFLLVINALMVMLTSAIVRNFKVSGFWNALLFSIIISLVRILLLSLFSV